MFRETIFNSLGGGVKIILNFISIPILINQIGYSNYGIWIIISTLVNIFILIDGGVVTSVIYFLSKLKEKNSHRFKNEVEINKFFSSSILLLLIINIIVICFVSIQVDNISLYFIEKTGNKNINFSQLIFIILVTAIAIIYQQFIYAILQVLLDYRYINVHKVVTTVIQQSLILLIVYYKFSFYNLCLILLLTSIVPLVISGFYTVNFLPKTIKFVFEIEYLKKVLYYSLSAWSGYLGNSMFTQVDKIIVSHILGIKDLGIYSAITNNLSFINSISAVPIQSLTVHASISGGDTKNVKDKMRKSFNLTLCLSFIIAVFMVYYLSFLNLLGNNINASIILILCVLIYFLYSLNAVGYYYLLGTGKPKTVSVIILFAGILSLILIFIFGNIFSLNGCLLGNIGFVTTVYMTKIAFKDLNLEFDYYKSIALNTFFIGVILLLFLLKINFLLNIIIGITLVIVSVAINNIQYKNVIVFMLNKYYKEFKNNHI